MGCVLLAGLVALVIWGVANTYPLGKDYGDTEREYYEGLRRLTEQQRAKRAADHADAEQVKP